MSQVASSSGDIDVTNSSVFYVDSPLFLGPLPQSVKIEQTSTPVEASNRGDKLSSISCTSVSEKLLFLLVFIKLIYQYFIEFFALSDIEYIQRRSVNP